jgi:hypothetical protein
MCIEIRYRVNDIIPPEWNDNDTNTLIAIYGKSHSKNVITNVFRTCVNYHKEAPTFFDEVKIKMPMNINEKHHLLFTYEQKLKKKWERGEGI